MWASSFAVVGYVSVLVNVHTVEARCEAEDIAGDYDGAAGRRLVELKQAVYVTVFTHSKNLNMPF